MEYRLRVYLYHLGILERKHGKLGVSTGTIRNEQILQNRQIDAIFGRNNYKYKKSAF